MVWSGREWAPSKALISNVNLAYTHNLRVVFEIWQKSEKNYLRVLWGGKPLKSSVPQFGVMDMIDLQVFVDVSFEVLLGYPHAAKLILPSTLTRMCQRSWSQFVECQLRDSGALSGSIGIYNLSGGSSIYRLYSMHSRKYIGSLTVLPYAEAVIYFMQQYRYWGCDVCFYSVPDVVPAVPCCAVSAVIFFYTIRGRDTIRGVLLDLS